MLRRYLRSLINPQLRQALDSGDGVNPDEQANNRRQGGRLRCKHLTSDRGPVLDISRTGARIRIIAKKTPEVGSEIELTLQFGDTHEPIRATVVRSHRIARRLHEIGIEFDLIDEEQRRRLAGLVQMANSQLMLTRLDRAS